jgi:bifunctional non-homologous end joining protein LigD
MATPTAHDRLETYRAKRDFSKTSEPRGRAARAKRERAFVIQRHAARREHYDFRLEHHGVLLSWAVPKGPSLDPGDKRLAVHVEDHPLEYGGFEGSIPSGEYGAGTVMLWDRGSWEPHGDVDEGLEKGKLSFTLHGERLQGGWALVRLRARPNERRDNWLLIKEQDEEAERDGDALIENDGMSVKSGRSMEEISKSGAVWHSNRGAGDDGAQKPKSTRATGAVRPAEPGQEEAVAGIHLTNPDRVLYPDQGVTKRALADYYVAVAERMLPHIAGRPLALVRCPQGRAEECFFQKHASQGWPNAFGTIEITEKSATREYMYVEDVAGLVAAAQMGVLELHVWGSHAEKVEQPDRMVFDLDPDEALPFADVKAAARDLKRRLEEIGLLSFPMVTGGKGIHVVVPLERRHGWSEHRAFAEAMARHMAAEQPERYVAVMSKAKRRGKIFIDYLRNQRGATAIAPFSTRAKAGATIALPVSWQGLGRLANAHPATIRTVKRFLGRADPWKDYGRVRQHLPRFDR